MNTRRRFLLVLAALYPGLSGAQPAKLGGKPVRVGILSAALSSSAQLASHRFVDAMRELGWIGGRNIVYDRVYAEGDEARLPALAMELLARRPDLVYVQTHPEARAVLERTRTIPIVFGAANNPHPGFVKSLAPPGGNVTGIANIGWELGGRRMQLLKEVLPKISRVGVLVSPVGRSSSEEQKLVIEAAGAGVRVIPAKIREASEFDTAFAFLSENRVEAVLATHLAIFRRERKRILDLAAKQRIPLIGFRSDMANDGALMSYGALSSEQIRRSAYLVDAILKGTRPADIPVEQPTTFELVVNMKTAKALGITIPQSILLQASRVIE